MSQLKKRFETKASAIEMKRYIDTNFIPNPDFKPFVEKVEWLGNVLHVTSKYGKGTITIEDNLVDIDLNLSLLASMAKGKIESALDNEFKKFNQ